MRAVRRRRSASFPTEWTSSDSARGPATEALCRQLGLPPDAPVVGIVAALRPEKNHALFLRAAARVRRTVSGARFLLVGDGPQRGELESLAASLDIGEVAHFLGTRSDVPELLSLIDVLALSSHIEANPVSILEAMAAEKPVVATRVGSVDKAVHDGQTGYVVAPGSEEELASRLVELLRDRFRAATFGRAGRRHVVEHASIERMVSGYEELLEEIYGRKTLAFPARNSCCNGPRYNGRILEVGTAGSSGTDRVKIAASTGRLLSFDGPDIRVAREVSQVFMIPPVMVKGQAEERDSQADQQRNQQDDQDDHQAGPIPTARGYSG